MKRPRTHGLPDDETEAIRIVELETRCRGCGGDKFQPSYFALVCGSCWKGNNDGFQGNGIESLKYFRGGGLLDWLRHLDATGQKPAARPYRHTKAKGGAE